MSNASPFSSNRMAAPSPMAPQRRAFKKCMTHSRKTRQWLLAAVKTQLQILFGLLMRNMQAVQVQVRTKIERVCYRLRVRCEEAGAASRIRALKRQQVRNH